MKKYYNAEELIKANADINIIDGARKIGKSTDICRRAILDSIESNGAKGGIIYVRRKENQVKNIDVEMYIKEERLKKWTKNEWECIKVIRGFGYLAKCTGYEENGKPIWKYSTYPVIKGFALKKADDYKSLNISFDYMIYEEYQTNDGYIEDEVNKLMSLYWTFERGSKNFHLYMVANTVCRINPYVNEWGLTNYNKQKKGTIDLYKLYLGLFDEFGNEKFITIAREYSDLTTDGNDDNYVKSKIEEHKKRKRLNLMVTRGEWEEINTYLTISYQEVKNLKQLYKCFFISQNACFKLQLFYDKENKMYFPYIVPHKSEIKEKNPRIISNDRYYTSPYFTKGLIALSDGEKKIFELIKHHSRFCNNLTGNEFFSMLKNF